MTKTYRINGKEIQGFVHRQHKFHPSDFVEERFNQLLEALSDKEEKWVKCTCGSQTKPKGGTVELAGVIHSEERPCYEEPKQEVCQKCPRYPNAIIGMLDKDGKCNVCQPKQEECTCKEEVGTIHIEGGKTICTNCNKTYNLKQEKCLDCYEIIGNKGGAGKFCEKHKPIYSEPKQSTSLKEKAAEIIYEYLRASGITYNTIDSKEIASQLLFLLQNNLRDAVENTTQYKSPTDRDWVYEKKDIIKIINNIK